MDKTQKKNVTRLYRSETDRLLAGVAGGIAEYFNIDSLVVRIILLLLLFSGPGILLYLVLWLIIPTKANSERTPQETIKDNADEIKIKTRSLANDFRQESKKHNPKLWAGILLIVVGALLFFDNFGIFRFFSLFRLWPLLLVLMGIIILSKNQNGRE